MPIFQKVLSHALLVSTVLEYIVDGEILHSVSLLTQSDPSSMEKTIQISNEGEGDTESNENVSGEIPQIDPAVEKSLVRRMDLILLPTLCKPSPPSF